MVCILPTGGDRFSFHRELSAKPNFRGKFVSRKRRVSINSGSVIPSDVAVFLNENFNVQTRSLRIFLIFRSRVARLCTWKDYRDVSPSITIETDFT